MKRLLLAAIVAMAASGSAWAQSSTGTGVGVAESTSGSQAVSGQAVIISMARLDTWTLWSTGLKKAAVERLCLNGDIYRAMPEWKKKPDEYLVEPETKRTRSRARRSQAG
jgi:hypothetical protein